MSDFSPPPPPPPPSAPLSTVTQPLMKEGKGVSLSEQISASSNIIQSIAATGWYDANDEKRYAERQEYVGLSNQGATCYLNSLIQSLYMTPEFRSAIYKWKYDPLLDDEPQYCIPLQLQTLFARLQLSCRAFVETRDLTKSFRWTENDSFQQHDVQELMRVLFDALERSYSQGLPTAHTLIEHLYRGTLSDYIDCTQCHTPRFRQDTFLDIPLVIRDVSSIQDAISRYTEPELLDNDNQYSCDVCKVKTNALKGLKLIDFPFLLCLQLKRFDFDWNTMQRVKLNSKVEFPLYLPIGEGYELCTVMIASGGALGGHYYVCARNVETGKWFKFDDSSVTAIDESELEKYYGTEEKKPGWGTSAYMLVYRRKGGDQKVDMEVPPEIAEIVYKENAEFAEAREKYLLRKDNFNLKVFYKDKSVTAIVHKSTSLQETTKIVYEEINKIIPLSLPLDCVRLRDYNAVRKLLGQAYSGREAASLEELQIHNNKQFQLETRNFGEEFPPDADYIVKVALVSSEKYFEEQSGIEFGLSMGSTLGDLKDAISRKFAIEREKVLVVRISANSPIVLTDDNKTLKFDYKIIDGTLLFCEDCFQVENSVIVKQVEQSQYMIDISFNIPGQQVFDQDVLMDKRQSVKELKMRISACIGIPAEEFKMCRNLVRHEYKKEDQTLEEAGFFDGSAVYVEKGKPLKVGEYQVSFFKYDSTRADSWEPWETLILEENQTVQEIKKIVAEKLNVSFIRLRDKSGNKAGKCLVDSKTLQQAVSPLYDGKELAVQMIKIVDPEINETKMMIEIQRWFPQKWELSSREEVIIDKETTVGEFKLIMSNLYNIPNGNVGISKPRAYQLKDVSQIPSLPWEVEDQWTLTGTPFHIHDGDVVLVKDVSEPEKEGVSAEAAAQAPKVDRPRAPEPSIVIRTRYDMETSNKPTNQEELPEA